MAKKSTKKPSALRSKIAASFKSKLFRSGSYSLAAGAVVIAIAVVVNLIVAALPQSWTLFDTTSSGIFSISPQTEQIVDALTEDVTLVWVVSDANEDVYIEQLLENYDGMSEHIDLVKIDPVSSPVRLKELAGDDIDATAIEDNSVIVKSGRMEKLLSYHYDIYTYSDYYTWYQYYYYYGYDYVDTFCAERSITSTIAYVTSEELPVMYVLSGHGEIDISGFYGQFEAENIRIKELNLATAGAVPDDCACLLLSSPTSDIPADQISAIADYIAAGGKMLLTTTYLSNEEAPNLLGLMSDRYGVQLVDGIVIEGDSDYHYVGFPNYLYPQMESHSITDPLISAGYNIIIPDAQGLVVAETLPEGVTVSPLVSTSDAAFSSLQPNEELSRVEGDPSGPFDLAVAVTVDGGGNEEGEIVWISSIYLLDSMTNEMSSGANMDMFLNAINWMCDNEAGVSVREITLTNNYLTMTQSAATTFTIVLIAVIPALFVIEGVVTVVKRRRAK